MISSVVRFSALCLLVSLFVPVGALLAQEPSEDVASPDAPGSLDLLREMVLHARYAEAVPVARALLSQDNLSAQERLTVLELLATVHIAERDESSASATLDALYQRDPGYRADPQASPVVLAAFETARANAGSVIEVRIEHIPPASSQPQVSARITTGRDAVDRMRISYRVGESGPSFTEVVAPVSLDGAVEAMIGGGPGTHTEYFIEALAPSGAVLTSHGSAAEPLRMNAGTANQEVPTPTTLETSDESIPLWVWIGAGGAVLLGVTIVLIAVASGGSLPDSSLGEGALQ